MREPVGVKTWLDIFVHPSLKREALMCNRIAITDYCAYLQLMRDSSNPFRELFLRKAGWFLDELEWLFDKGVVIDVNVSWSNNLLESNCEYRTYRNLARQERKPLARLVDNHLRESSSRAKTGEPNLEQVIRLLIDNQSELDAMQFLPRMAHISQYEARLACVELRELSKMDAFPILLDRIITEEVLQANKSDVIEIVINSLPVPDDSVAWEEILDYRNDPDSHSKFLSLRNWINEVARAKLTPIEVEQKLEYLIDQYQQHMKLHKMKTKVGTLETVVVASAEFLEDFVKFKWGKIAKDLFSFKHRRIALLEGELTAPGNEIAYIVKARKRFS